MQTTLDFNLAGARQERHVDATLDKQDNRDVSQAALITLAPDGAIRALASAGAIITSASSTVR